MYPVNAVHVDKVLTNVSVKYVNNDFASEALFPVQKVNKQSDKYRVYGLNHWRAENDLRGPGAVANELPPSVMADTPYYAQEHALQKPIPKEERDNNDGFNLDVDTTNELTDKILLGREVAAFNIAGDSAKYATGLSTTLTAGNKLTDSTADVVAPIRAAIEAVYARILRRPNTLVIGYNAFQRLINHGSISDYLKSGLAVADESDLKKIIGIPKIVIPGMATYTGATSGSPYNFIWDDKIVVAYVDSRNDAPTFGREFNWGYPQTMLVDRWNEPQRKSDIIRAARRYDLKPVGVEITEGHADYGKIIAGYLINDVM